MYSLNGIAEYDTEIDAADRGWAVYFHDAETGEECTILLDDRLGPDTDVEPLADAIALVLPAADGEIWRVGVRYAGSDRIVAVATIADSAVDRIRFF